MGFHVRKSIPLPGPFYYSLGGSRSRRRRRRSSGLSAGGWWVVLLVAGLIAIPNAPVLAVVLLALWALWGLAWYYRRSSRPTVLVPAQVPQQSRYIPQAVRVAVAARDRGRCVRCGAGQELHYDHVVPFSRGGSNAVQNLQLLCGPCNRAKGGNW